LGELKFFLCLDVSVRGALGVKPDAAIQGPQRPIQPRADEARFITVHILEKIIPDSKRIEQLKKCKTQHPQAISSHCLLGKGTQLVESYAAIGEGR
jgi:hypothetical protein